MPDTTEERTRPNEKPTSGAQSGESSIIDLNAAWAAQQGVEPHEVRPYRPRPIWLRVALLVALLLLAALLIPPVRAWILETLAAIVG